jgi:CDP-diacylglycerol--glycerol-3-phosphate 3-phosphatidyltransferase/cardiolipin synthase
VKRWISAVDALTALRVPLAIAFPFVHRPATQLAVVVVVAASDVLDGMLARRVGSSRMGAVLDPVADKVFMTSAFVTIGARGVLSPLEVLGVLSRDILAVVGFLGTWLLRRPAALPARTAGKAVTVAQMVTLCAAIILSPLVRPLAWATTAAGLYAALDYGRAVGRQRASGGVGNGT